MPIENQFVFYDSSLRRIGARPVVSASYSRRLNRIGTCTLFLDAKENDFSVFSQDGLGLIIQVSDNINPIGTPDLDAYWLLVDFAYSGAKSELYEMVFVDALDLLDRRRVAYFADEPRGASPQARINEPGNVALKRIFDENLGELALTRNLSPFVTSRNINFPSPLIHKTIQWKSTISAMVEVCKASREKGTPLYFDIIARETSQLGISLEFVTYVGARGKDHRQGQDVRIRTTDPNFDPDSFRIRYDIPNVAYVAGSGKGVNRPLVEVSNERATSGIFTRRETYKSIQETDPNILSDEGLELITGRGLYSLGGRLLGDLAGAYNYGDVLNIEHENLVIASEISHATVNIEGTTYEKVLKIESI